MPMAAGHGKRRRLANLKFRLAGLEADLAAGRVRLCFGSKKLWRKQHHLEQNGYASHEEWQQDWRDVRSNEFFVLGSRDETAGCQLCVASVNDDGLTFGCGCRTAWRNRTANIWWFQTCGLLLGMMWSGGAGEQHGVRGVPTEAW